MANICKIIFVLLVFASCTDNRKVIDQEITSIKDLQCQAAKFNKNRFDLFEQIRAIEEKTPIDTVAVDSLKKKAQGIKMESLKLADSLSQRLTGFLKSHQLNKEDRTYFDEKINALIEECKK
ncbi:MAG: hypothetical protein R2774_08140 [Saprospiraceae bacterium]